MRTGAIFLILALLSALLLSACTQATDPTGTDPPIDTPDPSLHNATERGVKTAILDFEADIWDDPETVDRYARTDVLILGAERLWGESSDPNAVAKLRAANPDLKILAYVRSKHIPLIYSEKYPNRNRNQYPYNLYDVTRPYWSFTTTGDTLSDFPEVVVLNTLDPACRQALIETYTTEHLASSNRVDGFYWDYFSLTLWIPDVVRDYMDGEPDLDGDGIVHFDDEDELAAFQLAQELIIEGVRNRLGVNFIQIFNGSRAHRDSTFAALGDGMFYEHFPTLSFHGGPNMENALGLQQYNNLFTARTWPRSRNGGPWLILSAKSRYTYTDDQGERINLNLGDINRAVALLTDCTSIYHFDGKYIYGWPDVDLKLGKALGGVVFDDRTITRQFERGQVSITMTTGDPPIPFNYEIVQDDEVVQSLAYPTHFP
ncbi:MAG: putative glycoside hydrolase [bacterium]